MDIDDLKDDYKEEIEHDVIAKNDCIEWIQCHNV